MKPRKPRAIHFGERRPACSCGRHSNRWSRTTDKSKVTCEKCLAYIKHAEANADVIARVEAIAAEQRASRNTETETTTK